MNEARAWLEPRWRELGLTGDCGAWLAACGLPLAQALARRAHAARAAGRVLVVGVAGAQGTGKSSACQLLVPLLAQAYGLRAWVLPLDDFYLPKAARERLAREVHPLLATRGVPGTHDLPRLLSCLQALRTAADSSKLELPRFSKAHDDRAPDTHDALGRFDVVLFEGWCVGAQAQPESALAQPCNALEAEADADGRFRRYVNTQLAGPYASLFAALDALVFFAAPNMRSVYALRREQEDALRRVTGHGGMGDAELARFIAHFERITVHMLQSLPQHADVVIQLDEARQITGFADRAPS